MHELYKSLYSFIFEPLSILYTLIILDDNETNNCLSSFEKVNEFYFFHLKKKLNIN